MPLLSIVVPVYNIQMYLSDCVESIRRQPFDDWEMVLIDDHSTDGSGDLCDEWARIDPRIKALHLEKNMGPGGARNAGLACVDGEYVLFLDGDDLLAESALSRLAETINHCSRPDIIKLDFREFFGHADAPPAQAADGVKPRVLSVDMLLHECMQKENTGQHGARFYLWQLIMRRALLVQGGFAFQNLWIGEDVEFSLRVLFAAERVCQLTGPFYQWRVRLSGSLTAEHIRFWHQLLRAATEILQLSDGAGLSKIQRQWAIDNANSYVRQFEQVAATVSDEDLLRHKVLSAEFSRHVRRFAERFSENGLLWYIESQGAQIGISTFCRKKAGVIHQILSNKASRGLYILPATRRSLIFAEVARALGYRFAGMLDNDVRKQGLLLAGYAVLKPETLALCFDDRDSLFVVVSASTRRTRDVLCAQLRGYGLVDGKHFACLECDQD